MNMHLIDFMNEDIKKKLIKKTYKKKETIFSASLPTESSFYYDVFDGKWISF